MLEYEIKQLIEIYPQGEDLKDIVGIYVVKDAGCMLYNDMKEE